MQIYALHGFLGLPSDWDFLHGKLTCKFHAINIYESFEENLGSWANNFNQSVANAPGKKILLGYSLGGRLAIHALMANSNLWDAAIIISSHPGGLSDSEKKSRLDNDRQWAEKFTLNPWDEVLFHWNTQPALASSKPLIRKENQFNKNILAQILIHWSLAQQQDFTYEIQKVNKPIFWVAGLNDHTYASRAIKYRFQHPMSKIWIAMNSGHRLPWDISPEFTNEINQFINKIM